MPTYTCTSLAGLLDEKRKQSIARAVTAAHCELTGAPAYFAQVLFQDAEAGDVFVGGSRLAHGHVFLHGHIRAGRPASLRDALIRRLVDDVAAAAGIDHFGVWVYLLELPPAAMAEFGHVLPVAGGESAWDEALPPEDRARMQAIRARFGR